MAFLSLIGFVAIVIIVANYRQNIADKKYDKYREELDAKDLKTEESIDRIYTASEGHIRFHA